MKIDITSDLHLDFVFGQQGEYSQGDFDRVGKKLIGFGESGAEILSDDSDKFRNRLPGSMLRKRRHVFIANENGSPRTSLPFEFFLGIMEDEL